VVSPHRVVAVVVTFNRRRMLMECLEALARQTHPVAEVIVVDNASTDGTREALETTDLPERLDLSYLRLRRNGGGAEGQHYGWAAALERDADWIWVMDDDCEADPGTLAALLASPRAAETSTVALAPRAVSGDRAPLPLERGRIRGRWFLAPLVALPDSESAAHEAQIDFSTFVGPIVRAAAARRVGLPLRRAFIHNDDVEYFARLRGQGRSWLVGASSIRHKAAVPLTDASFAGRLREYLRPGPFAGEWKRMYALRNLVHTGRRHGFLSGGQALCYVATQAGRRLAFGERRLRTARLVLLFGLHGWRGVFRNLTPDDWPVLASVRSPGAHLRRHGLRYADDVAEPIRRLASRP
jgi:GT2 family glycosyltransferase